MYKKKAIWFSFVAVLIGGVALVSCNRDAHSTPQFIHKSPVDAQHAFKMGEDIFTNDDLVTGIEYPLFEAQMRVYNLKINSVRTILAQKLMDQDPRKKGLSNDEYLEKYISKDVKASPKDVDDFLKERNIPEAAITDDLKERARQVLVAERRRDEVAKWLDRHLAKNPVEIYFEKPNRPVFNVNIGDAPFMGGASAKVTIAAFSDFQCPYCARGAKRLEEIKKKYGNRVKIVFKNFPLPSHTDAPLAAEAGLCARKLKGNDTFWEFHDKLFANQSNLAKQELINHAKSVGLDEKMFTECLDSREFRAKVEADKMEGQALRIRSTPTFFINGKLVPGLQDLSVFTEIIDEDLQG